MKHYPTLNQPLKYALLLAAGLPAAVSATPVTVSQKVEADTYVSSGQPTVNFGSMGAMMIAVPTAAQARTEESLIRFNTAAIKTAFDADYGAGNWTITSITLSLFSNYSTAGAQPGNSSFNKIAAGGFELDWLSYDSWVETAITWNTLSTVLPGTGGNTSASLGTFNWAADGSASQIWSLGLDANLLSDIASGGKVSIFGQPTAGSTVGYLFNTLNNSPAYLNVTADVLATVPEPTALALAACGLAGFAALRRWKNQ